MPAEYTESFVAAFLDAHTGYALLNAAIAGTAVVTGDVVSITLTGPTAVGSAAALAGGQASPTAINAEVSGNVVTPAVVPVSYTATSGDSGQATLPLRLQAVATGLVNAINASAAVTGGTAFLQTVSAPVNATFQLVAKLPGGGGAMPGYVAGVTITAATSATPGGVGHAAPTPAGTTPFGPQNPNLHVPTNDGTFTFSFGPNGQTSLIEFTGGEPIILDPLVYAAALSAGISFSF